MHDEVEWSRSSHPNPFLFEPKRLWLGSANFTWNSRRSIEFGIWSDEPELLAHAEKFLTDLISFSEPLDSQQIAPEPEWAPIEEDDAAMREYVALHGFEWDLGDE